MIYTKCRINGEIVKVPLNEEAMFSECPICGVEVEVDTEVLIQIVHDNDLKFSSVYCDPCSEKHYEDKKPKITRIK